jgi:hypothetical protein
MVDPNGMDTSHHEEIGLLSRIARGATEVVAAPIARRAVADAATSMGRPLSAAPGGFTPEDRHLQTQTIGLGETWQTGGTGATAGQMLMNWLHGVSPNSGDVAALSRTVAAGYLQKSISDILARQRTLPRLPGSVSGSETTTAGGTLQSGTGKDGGPLPSTGVPRFDRRMVGTEVFDKWKATLESRGWTVTVKELNIGTAADITRGKQIAVDPNQFRYIDLLHESRHVRQLNSLFRAGHEWVNKRSKGLFETHAYRYEQRLGKRFGFAPEYVKWTEARELEFWTPTVRKAAHFDPDMQELWR